MSTKQKIAAALALAGVLVGSGAASHAATVQVLRGSMSATIVETREAGVRVFRGTPTAPVRGTAVATVGGSESRAVAAGGRLWLVDRAAGSLSVCSLVATTQVGERRIDCHSGQLPQ